VSNPSPIKRIIVTLSGPNLKAAQLERLRAELEALPGVIGAFISAQTAMAHLVFDSERIKWAQIQKRLEEAGLEVGTLGLGGEHLDPLRAQGA